MQKFDLFILVAAAILNISIATLIFLKNKRHLSNRLFLALVASLVFWTTANYFSVELTNSAAVFESVNWVLTAVVLQNTFFFLFVAAFPGNKLSLSKRIAYTYVVLSCFVLMISIYPGFFSGYEVIPGSITPIPSPLIVLFILHVVFSIIGGLIWLIFRYLRTNDIKREQIRFVIIASSILLLATPLTNFVFPIVFDTNFFVPIGPLYTLAFAAIIAYTMVKHRLFDFRNIVAKAFAYLLTFGMTIVIYTVVVVIVSSLILRSVDIPLEARVLYTGLAVLVAFSFVPIKNFFDRITNRLFYRDAYDPQEFLDELNNSIVNNIEIGILLRHTTKVIEENLKSGFVQVVIPKTESTAQRIAGTKSIKYSDHELNYIRGRLVGLGNKVVSIDDLGEQEEELRKIMNKFDISVLVHLTATSYGQVQTIAFMVLGSKKSGNNYSGQDLRIIDIIADELVIAIQNALRFEEIQEFNVTLQSKVNTATTKLRKTNDKLKAIDATKDEFISMASHQLRTPLTSVKGYLSMVLEGDAGEINETQRKLLDQAFVSSQRMVYLIADLLNVSRLRTGKFIIDAGQANLAEVVEGEVSQLKEQANAKHINLSYEKPKEFPNLVIDETKTRQVVMNFVDNALYYTPAGGKIEVSLTEDKNHIYFMVKDNGLGVPKDEQKHLFTKFYRAKNARNVRPDGTGLGLFMAKKVITAQSGNILFESKEGKGSTFGFSFSKKLLAVPDDEGHKA